MINNRLEPTCIRTLLRSSCCCAVVPEQDLHTESVHPPLVVDHPVVDVHLADVAEVPLSAEPLPGLRHAGQTEVATREVCDLLIIKVRFPVSISMHRQRKQVSQYKDKKCSFTQPESFWGAGARARLF